MEIQLAGNIRKFRKERKMTQEQLAEALGVTVGAVYKWEKDLSTPELSLIFAMADLFGTSTDVLLGYQWQSGHPQDALESVRQLLRQKQFGQAVETAERAVKKFPNHFEVVHQCALAYLEWSRTFDLNQGIQEWQEKAHTRGTAVFRHALELLPQNTDPAINQISLCRQLAQFHEFCMYIYDAIEVLRESNVCGIHDPRIGYLFVAYVHDCDRAEPYLTRAYTALLNDLDAVIMGFADLCSRRGDANHGIACLQWLRNIHRGIQPEDTVSVLDWYDAFLLRTQALLACQKGDFVQARAFLQAALEKAIRYDSQDPETMPEMEINRVMHMESYPNYADLARAGSAMERLDAMAYFPEDFAPRLAELWQEVKKEAGLCGTM